LLLVAISIPEASAGGAGNSVIGEPDPLTEDVTSIERLTLVNTFWQQDVSTRIYVRFGFMEGTSACKPKGNASVCGYSFAPDPAGRVYNAPQTF